MPRTTTGRQDTPLVQLSADSSYAGEALGSQVIHDGSQVRRTVLCVPLDRSHSLLVADLLPLERSCTIGIAKLHTPNLGSGKSAAFVRSLISPTSNFATEDISWIAEWNRRRASLSIGDV